MICLETNKVCPNTAKRCKECKLDDCKQTLNIIEEHEKEIMDEKIIKIIKELPDKCKECKMYEITDVQNKKVYCPYMIKNSCLIK